MKTTKKILFSCLGLLMTQLAFAQTTCELGTDCALQVNSNGEVEKAIYHIAPPYVGEYMCRLKSIDHNANTTLALTVHSNGDEKNLPILKPHYVLLKESANTSFAIRWQLNQEPIPFANNLNVILLTQPFKITPGITASLYCAQE